MTPLTGTAGEQSLLPDADQAPLDETRSPAFAAGAQPDLAQTSLATAGGNSPGERWHEIQSMFVDDPRSAVEMAAGLVGDSAETVMASVRERQQALLSAWQHDDTGTEDLRIALRHYREFWNRLRDFPREL